MTNIRVIFTLFFIHYWTVFQMDVKSAFLYGHLKETVYMKPHPDYFSDISLVCKLKKALYGLKQAPRTWFERFHHVILGAGFKQSYHVIYPYLSIIILKV